MIPSLPNNIKSVLPKITLFNLHLLKRGMSARLITPDGDECLVLCGNAHEIIFLNDKNNIQKRIVFEFGVRFDTVQDNSALRGDSLVRLKRISYYAKKDTEFISPIEVMSLEGEQTNMTFEASTTTHCGINSYAGVHPFSKMKRYAGIDPYLHRDKNYSHLFKDGDFVFQLMEDPTAKPTINMNGTLIDADGVFTRLPVFYKKIIRNEQGILECWMCEKKLDGYWAVESHVIKGGIVIPDLFIQSYIPTEDKYLHIGSIDQFLFSEPDKIITRKNISLSKSERLAYDIDKKNTPEVAGMKVYLCYLGYIWMIKTARQNWMGDYLTTFSPKGVSSPRIQYSDPNQTGYCNTVKSLDGTRFSEQTKTCAIVADTIEMPPAGTFSIHPIMPNTTLTFNANETSSIDVNYDVSSDIKFFNQAILKTLTLSTPLNFKNEYYFSKEGCKEFYAFWGDNNSLLRGFLEDSTEGSPIFKVDINAPNKRVAVLCLNDDGVHSSTDGFIYPMYSYRIQSFEPEFNVYTRNVVFGNII